MAAGFQQHASKASCGRMHSPWTTRLGAGKFFTQEKGCEKILFGHDDIVERHQEHPGELRQKRRHVDGIPEDAFRIEHVGNLIVVEGEMDKLACNEVCPRHPAYQ